MDDQIYDEEKKSLSDILKKTSENGADAAYNKELKIIAYRENDVGNDYFQNRLFREMCYNSEKKGESISEINKKTKYLTKEECPIEGFFLEKVLGYKRV